MKVRKRAFTHLRFLVVFSVVARGSGRLNLCGVATASRPTGVFSSVAGFEWAVEASVFSVDCRNEANQQLSDASQGETDLRNRLLCCTNDAEEHAKHTERIEDGDGDRTGGFRLSLGGMDGVSPGQLDELEYCLADEPNRSPSEGRPGNISIRFECFFSLVSVAFSN